MKSSDFARIIREGRPWENRTHYDSSGSGPFVVTETGVRWGQLCLTLHTKGVGSYVHMTVLRSRSWDRQFSRTLSRGQSGWGVALRELSRKCPELTRPLLLKPNNDYLTRMPTWHIYL